MLDTCNARVGNEAYNYQDATLDEDLEMEIWKAHNPGMFSE